MAGRPGHRAVQPPPHEDLDQLMGGEEDGQRVMKQQEITVRVGLGRGTAADQVWTCDFSHEYVTINADYRS